LEVFGLACTSGTYDQVTNSDEFIDAIIMYGERTSPAEPQFMPVLFLHPQHASFYVPDILFIRFMV
jgi:hypothetical protein